MHCKPLYNKGMIKSDHNNNNTKEPNQMPSTNLNDLLVAVNKAIDEVTKDGAVKPVQLAQIVGVREQMVYRYIADKRIASYETPGGYKRIKAEKAKEWANKYLTRKADRDS